jgi:hypothetical protein
MADIKIDTYGRSYCRGGGDCYYPPGSNVCTARRDYYSYYKATCDVKCAVCKSREHRYLVNITNRLYVHHTYEDMIKSCKAIVCKEGDCRSKYIRILERVIQGFSVKKVRKLQHHSARQPNTDKFLTSLRRLYWPSMQYY